MANSKSNWHDFFFAVTNERRVVWFGREVEGTFMYIHTFFPPAAPSVACSQHVLRVYMQCALHCYFLGKWQNDSCSGIASNFARSLAIAKWKPFRRFSRYLVIMPWASHKLRSGTTDSKVAACWWTETLVSDRPSTSPNDELINQVWTMVMQDHCVTIWELAEEVGTSTGSVHSILTNDLVMRTVSAKLMLRPLTMQQKQLRLEVSQDLLDYPNSDLEFLNIVTTGDELWVYRYNLETKEQSSQWKHSTYPRPKKARQVWSNVKVMLTVFF